MTTITKRQFRLLLLGYVALTVAGIFALPQSTPLTDADVAITKSRYALQGLSDHQFATFMSWFIGAGLLAWLVGLISLFLLWRPAAYVFLAGVCGRLAVEYLSQLTPTGDWVIYGAVALIWEFTIVSLALFGPGKHLFQKQRAIQI